jgi:asparagine synthetase B (glutamine-hydrolysing)
MCGIADLAYRRAYDFPQEGERRVQTMIDVQAHRGPNVRQYHRSPLAITLLGWAWAHLRTRPARNAAP